MNTSLARNISERLRPDFDATATGYRWLDRFTAPYWRWKAKRERRKLHRLLSRGDALRGRRLLEDAAFAMWLDDHGVDERMRDAIIESVKRQR